MKRRLLLIASMALLFVFVLAFSISADSINGSTSNEYGTLTTIDGVSEPSIIDENAKAVVVVNGTYYTIPTYYLIADDSHFSWSVNSTVASTLGLPTNTNVRNNIVRIEIPEGIKTSHEISEGGRKFEGSPTLIEASLPTTLELMGEYFFDECKLLTTVKGLENTKLTKIYGNSFYSTTSLKCEITLPSTVTVIDFNAFRGSAITSINIPDAVTTLGDHVFAGCSNLSTVNISKNSQLTTLNGNYHFEKTALTSFYFPSSLTSLGTEGMFFSCSHLTSITNLENTQITNFPYRSFEGCPITSLTLPAGTTYIGKNAFKGNNIQQDTLVIPNGVTTLYECSFAGKKQTINKIILPANLTSFDGTYCFEYFYARNYYIPAGLSAFGECTFNGLTTKGVAFFFTGTKDQAEAIKSATNSNKNGAFTGATIVSLEEYTNATDKESKNYIVYGYNHCDAFYGGEHAFGEIITPEFTGGEFISSCNLFGTCTRKECAKAEIKETLNPLFGFMGFSKQEYGNGAVLQSFAVNNSILAKYTEVFGSDLSFGVLVAVDKLDVENADEQSRFNGVLFENGAFKEKVVTVDFTDKVYDIFEMKLTGLGNYQNASVYLCAYVVANGKINYLHNGSVSDTANTFTYNSIG